MNFFPLPSLTTLRFNQNPNLGYIFKLECTVSKTASVIYITYRHGCLCSDGQMAIFLPGLYDRGTRKLSRPVHCTLVEATAGYMYVYLWSEYAENLVPLLMIYAE